MTGPYYSLLVRTDIYFFYILGASLCVNKNLLFVCIAIEMEKIL